MVIAYLQMIYRGYNQLSNLLVPSWTPKNFCSISSLGQTLTNSRFYTLPGWCLDPCTATCRGRCHVGIWGVLEGTRGEITQHHISSDLMGWIPLWCVSDCVSYDTGISHFFTEYDHVITLWFFPSHHVITWLSRSPNIMTNVGKILGDTRTYIYIHLFLFFTI